VLLRPTLQTVLRTIVKKRKARRVGKKPRANVHSRKRTETGSIGDYDIVDVVKFTCEKCKVGSSGRSEAHEPPQSLRLDALHERVS